MIVTSGSPQALVSLLQSAPAISPWVLAIVAIILIVLFVWLLLRWQANRPPSKESKAPMASPESVRLSQVVTPAPATPPSKGETVMVAPEPAPVAALDDLEIIEGIGPKIASILKQAGITSFAQLAELNPERITEILQAGGIRLADPRTWPEQARLAAAGNQAALKALQDRLKGGREA